MKRKILFVFLILTQKAVFGAGMPTPSVPKVLPNTPVTKGSGL